MTDTGCNGKTRSQCGDQRIQRHVLCRRERAGIITFEFDADHKVTGFKIDLHSPDFHFWKLHFERQ